MCTRLTPNTNVSVSPSRPSDWVRETQVLDTRINDSRWFLERHSSLGSWRIIVKEDSLSHEPPSWSTHLVLLNDLVRPDFCSFSLNFTQRLSVTDPCVFSVNDYGFHLKKNLPHPNNVLNRTERKDLCYGPRIVPRDRSSRFTPYLPRTYNLYKPLQFNRINLTTL